MWRFTQLLPTFLLVKISEALWMPSRRDYLKVCVTTICAIHAIKTTKRLLLLLERDHRGSWVQPEEAVPHFTVWTFRRGLTHLTLVGRHVICTSYFQAYWTAKVPKQWKPAPDQNNTKVFWPHSGIICEMDQSIYLGSAHVSALCLYQKSFFTILYFLDPDH